MSESTHEESKELTAPDQEPTATLIDWPEKRVNCPACGWSALVSSRFCEACGLPFAPSTVVAGGGSAAEPDEGRDGLSTVTAVLSGGAAGPSTAALKPTDDLSAPPASGPIAPMFPPCSACGGAIAGDGYCEMCGQPALSARDHWEERLAPWVAGTCDRGIRHHRNEDAMALGLQENAYAAALVVCDGVSSSPDSDVASLAATKAAVEILVQPWDDPEAVDTTPELIREWSKRLIGAASAANAAVIEVTTPELIGSGNPPSCTFVAAVVDGPLVVTAWIGDSRAYWLPDTGTARALSVDDSWAQEAIAQGMSRVKAESAPHAHSITKWLGADAANFTARTDMMIAPGPGWVLVCSDGLWNYCSPAVDMAALVHETAARIGSDVAAITTELIRWANAQGGKDNITAVLARVEPGVTVPPQPNPSEPFEPTEPSTAAEPAQATE